MEAQECADERAVDDERPVWDDHAPSDESSNGSADGASFTADMEAQKSRRRQPPARAEPPSQQLPRRTLDYQFAAGLVDKFSNAAQVSPRAKRGAT